MDSHRTWQDQMSGLREGCEALDDVWQILLGGAFLVLLCWDNEKIWNCMSTNEERS